MSQTLTLGEGRRDVDAARREALAGQSTVMIEKSFRTACQLFLLPVALGLRTLLSATPCWPAILSCTAAGTPSAPSTLGPLCLGFRSCS